MLCVNIVPFLPRMCESTDDVRQHETSKGTHTNRQKVKLSDSLGREETRCVLFSPSKCSKCVHNVLCVLKVFITIQDIYE